LLKFVSAYLALSYLAFSTLVAAGALQVVAAWRSLAGLALLDYRRRPAWRHAAGPGLILLGYVWFFGTRRELFTPGPAGTELTLLFAAGVLLALAGTLVGAALLRPLRPRPAPPWPEGVQARRVRLPQGQGALLLQDPRRTRPGPALCLVADPASPPDRLAALAGRMAAQGWTVLVPAWEAELQRYPDALALVPAAVGFLCRQPLVDAGAVAVGGAGLGADLALRAAAEDAQLRAAVALAPLWEPGNARPGLGLLDEMTWPEARRWLLGGRRRALLAGLASAEALERVMPRPVLIVYGEADALVPISELRARLQAVAPAAELEIVPGEGHLSLPASERTLSRVAGWLQAHCGDGQEARSAS
jgi:fermentation-respiration switch protein FrsA (DUF1100 family)